MKTKLSGRADEVDKRERVKHGSKACSLSYLLNDVIIFWEENTGRAVGMVGNQESEFGHDMLEIAYQTCEWGSLVVIEMQLIDWESLTYRIHKRHQTR